MQPTKWAVRWFVLAMAIGLITGLAGCGRQDQSQSGTTGGASAGAPARPGAGGAARPGAGAPQQAKPD